MKLKLSLLATLLACQYAVAEPAAKGVIYLTFDDGPINASLPLLQELNAAGIKATFFVNAFHMYGEGDENEATAAYSMAQILASGHVVANHSDDHMLHNCTDGVESGAVYCNRVGLWPVNSYRNVETDLTYFDKNIQRLEWQVPGAALYANNKMTKLARLPYTNLWRVTRTTKGDGLCATSDTVPPWDPAFSCNPATSTNSSRKSAQIADILASRGYKLYGWDLDWGPENWGVAFPAETLADGTDLVGKVNAVINQCAPRTMDPLNSRTPNLDCSDGITRNKVVILAHDFLFEDGKRGKGATINLPKIRRFVAEAKKQGYRFDTLDNYAPQWQAFTQYKAGDFVSYQDKIYSVIQPHYSLSDWNPAATPALWQVE